MRLERLSHNKIKIFLTYDDLGERGLTKEDLWYNAPKVQQLFRDMMEEANRELGFELEGLMEVEVFSLQAQGMVVIVTREAAKEEDEEYFESDYIEMQVTLDESEDMMYCFQSFEDVISLSKYLHPLGLGEGQLLLFEEKYYLFIHGFDVDATQKDQLIAILAEFGNSTTVTIYRLIEYGKEIIPEKAIDVVYKYFVKNSPPKV